MKGKWTIAGILGVGLLLALAVGFSQAQGPEPPGEEIQPQDVSIAAVGSVIPIQGQLTDVSGSPLSGNYQITAGIYNVSSGGTALCSKTQTVNVSNGLFNMTIDNCTSNHINGQQLWLGIKVGTDAEMTPRQPIYPVPYAFSLKPGAVISDTLTSAVLNVYNHGTSWGLDVYSAGHDAVHGRTGSSNHAGVAGVSWGSGIGVYGESATGVAIRAAGTGTIQSTAMSYLFVPGTAFVKDLNTDSTRWDMMGAAARVWRGSTAGDKYIYIPITIPGVLYGQPVRISTITVYYHCQNGTNNYIDETVLFKYDQTVTPELYRKIVDDGGNQQSNTATSYTLTTNDVYNTLSPDQGLLTLRLLLHFVNDTDYIHIGGVQLTLEHD